MVLPSQQFIIMSPICRVQVEQLLWQLLIVALCFNVIGVDSTWYFESLMEISRLLHVTRQSTDSHTIHNTIDSSLEPKNNALVAAILLTLIPH